MPGMSSNVSVRRDGRQKAYDSTSASRPILLTINAEVRTHISIGRWDKSSRNCPEQLLPLPPPPRGCAFRKPPGGHLSHSWGPLALFPWTLQVMRGINAMSRLAAASRVLGNCFHTTFTGESGRRNRKPQQGFIRWDSPFPPPQSASTSSYRWGRGLLWHGNASDLLPLVSVRIKVLPPAGLQPRW